MYQMLLLVVGFDRDLQCLFIHRDIENVRPTADLTVFDIGLATACAEINEGRASLTAEGAAVFSSRLHETFFLLLYFSTELSTECFLQS